MEKQPLLNTYINNVTMSETVEAIEQMNMKVLVYVSFSNLQHIKMQRIRQ